MNLLAGLIGYGSFVLTLTLVGLIGYWKADQLEAWARDILAQKKNRA